MNLNCLFCRGACGLVFTGFRDSYFCGYVMFIGFLFQDTVQAFSRKDQVQVLKASR
jgi:hypothetical protein